MKIDIFKIAFLIAIFSSSLTSCDFEEMNEPKFQASEEDMTGDNFKQGAFFPQLQDIVFPAQENNYQMNENLLGDVYGRYMMTTESKWNSSSFAVYKAVPNWYSAPFKTTMTGVYTAWNEIRKQTNGEGINFAWAQILRVAAMQRLTDMYGPIPYSNVMNGDLKVSYDSQEDAYKNMFVDLTKAIKVLTAYVLADPDNRAMKQFDGIYEGDFREWVKFANSLKLRMAMRIRYANVDLAKEMAEEAVGHTIGVMTDNSDNAKYSYSKGNPITIMWENYKDIRACADITSYMHGFKDPRISKYFQESTINDEKGYFGLRSGIATVSEDWARQYSSPNILKSDPLMWMNVAEISLLRAEGAILGWNMLGDAKDLYETGIKQSFDQWGASGYSTYIADDANTQADYDDPNNIKSTSALSSITIKWDDASDIEAKLERIITQKWIALYPIGQEAWSEYRRTKYPKFFKVAQPTSVDLVVANRIPFAYDEYQNNTENINKAVGLLGGDDNYETKLWWDKK